MITHWILAAKLTDFTKKLSLMLVYLLMPLVVFFLTVRIKLPSRLVLFVYVPFLPSRCESGFTGERCAETLPMRVFIPERMWRYNHVWVFILSLTAQKKNPWCCHWSKRNICYKIWHFIIWMITKNVTKHNTTCTVCSLHDVLCTVTFTLRSSAVEIHVLGNPWVEFTAIEILTSPPLPPFFNDLRKASNNSQNGGLSLVRK